jgi:hypothetical protein
VAVVAGLLPEFCGAPGVDSRGVGLGDGERDEDPDNEGEDELDPVQPAPSSSVREEATDERANCGRSGVRDGMEFQGYGTYWQGR